MRALIQRVSFANVEVEGERVGEIEKGMMVLVGVGKEDTLDDGGVGFGRIGIRLFRAFSSSKISRSFATVSGGPAAIRQGRIDSGAFRTSKSRETR